MQVLINIINNASESICERFENVSEFPEGLIRIRLSNKNEDVISVEIIDNGIGLKENVKEAMYDAYYTTKNINKNSGIGLYMCKKIIEDNMNSSIDFTNNIEDFGVTCIMHIKKS